MCNSFSQLRCAQAILSSVAYNSTRNPNVMLSKDGQVIDVKGNQLQMSRVGPGFRLALRTVKELLKSIEFGEEIPVAYPEHIVDHPQEGRVGYSFLSTHKFAEENALLKRLLHNSKCTFFKEGTLIRSAAYDWLWRVKEAMVQLLLLIHVSAGLPSRGTEIVDIRIRNSGTGRLRNLYVMDEDLYVVYHYTKTSRLVDHDECIPHLIPDDLKELIMTYLVVIVPAAQTVAGLLLLKGEKRPEDEQVVKEFGEYFTASIDGRLNSETFSERLGSFTESFFGCHLKVNDHRHAMVLYDREFLERRRLDGGEETVNDRQAGHSSATADRHYARDANSLSELTSSTLRAYRQHNMEFQKTLGLLSDTAVDILPLHLKKVEKEKEDGQMREATKKCLELQDAVRDCRAMRPVVDRLLALVEDLAKERNKNKNKTADGLEAEDGGKMDEKTMDKAESEGKGKTEGEGGMGDKTADEGNTGDKTVDKAESEDDGKVEHEYTYLADSDVDEGVDVRQDEGREEETTFEGPTFIDDTDADGELTLEEGDESDWPFEKKQRVRHEWDDNEILNEFRAMYKNPKLEMREGQMDVLKAVLNPKWSDSETTDVESSESELSDWEMTGAGKRDKRKTGKTPMNILGVLPTGGGKSACYQLAAWSQRYTKKIIVIAPFVSLLQEQVANCEKLGIRARYYQESKETSTVDVDVIMCCLETSVNTSFLR